jgi:Xaa-Pro aminopeptidase
VHVGRPSDEARRLYEAVLEAQQAAIAAVRPGVTACRSGWRRAARAAQAETGPVLHPFDRAWFRIGDTRSARLAAGQGQKLEPGMVITIEPGAYVPGKWGVRIEDVVVVTLRAAKC